MRKGVHATAETASQSMPAGQLSVRTMASCYNCCAAGSIVRFVLVESQCVVLSMSLSVHIFLTLQAVFVVSVNLQGLFIFCFHCVRSTTVRSEWKTVLSRVTVYRASTTTSFDRSTTDSRYIFQCNVDLKQFKKNETKF